MFAVVIMSLYMLCMVVVLRGAHQLSKANRRVEAQQAAQVTEFWSQDRVDAQFRAMTVLLDVKA